MKNIKIIATTDIHGNIFPTNYTSTDNVEPIGLSRIATAIALYRKSNDVLLLDNGDSFQGTPLLTYAHKFKGEQMNPIAQAFNSLNYDYINLGNHDFNYGKESLVKFIKENKAPLLTSNITIDGKAPGQTQIIEKHGKKIALIGVLTQYIPNWERPSHIEDMTFNNAYESLKEEVNRVRDSVDFVIAMYHGGLERDPKTGEPTERLTGENQGYEMSAIEGIDLLITGHQHRSLIETLNGTLITQTTLKGEEFAVIDLNLETGEMHAQIVQSKDFQADPALLEPFQEMNNETQAWLDEVVGVLDGYELKIEDEFDARLNKHPLISLVNQVQMDRSGAQLASTAMFNGTVGFNQNITMRDLVNTYLYPNTIVVKEMSGKALKEMAEFSANYFALTDNGDIYYSPEFDYPKPQHYNYDMIDGVDYTIKVSNPRGSRIIKMTYQGKDVKDDDSFTMSVNNYRAMGGGNFTMVKDAPVVKEIQEDMVETIMEYFIKNNPVKLNHKDNITVVK